MATLPYAAPTTHYRPPALVRPTKRTLLLLILTTATFYWLHTRHDPWRHTATVHHAGDPRFEITNDRLVTFLPASVMRIWDNESGRLVATTEPINSYARDQLVCSGKYILRNVGYRCALIDLGTGEIYRQLDDVPAIYDVHSDLSVIWRKDLPDDPTLEVAYPFDNARPPVPIANAGHPDSARFSPDGKSVILKFGPGDFLFLPHEPSDPFSWERIDIRDITSGKHLLTLDKCRRRQSRISVDGKYFNAVREVAGLSPRSTFWVIDHYSIEDAARRSRIQLAGQPSCEFSPSGLHAFVPQKGNVIACYDLQSSRVVWTQSVQNAHIMRAFDDGSRILTAAPISHPGQLAIYNTDNGALLAILPGTLLHPLSAKVSPDGRTIAAASYGPSTTLHLYHPTGPDCPESTLGLFAFPHTALLLALLIATALSLRADAARHAPPDARRLLSTLLILAALPRAFHFLLAAALGQLLLTPAPLLLLAAVALRTGANVWRWTTFTLLALQLPLNLLCLHLLRNRGPNAATPILLDRTWQIPNLPLLITLPLLTFAILPALYHLARPPQHTP